MGIAMKRVRVQDQVSYIVLKYVYTILIKRATGGYHVCAIFDRFHIAVIFRFSFFDILG